MLLTIDVCLAALDSIRDILSDMGCVPTFMRTSSQYPTMVELEYYMGQRSLHVIIGINDRDDDWHGIGHQLGDVFLFFGSKEAIMANRPLKPIKTNLVDPDSLYIIERSIRNNF